MNKHQLACEAALHWEEVQAEAKSRQGKRTDLMEGDGVKFGPTRNVLAERFGVSHYYIDLARKLYLEDRERFDAVLRGEARLPGVVRNKTKEGKGEDSLALYRVYSEIGEL